eukprot:UN24684
MRNRHNKTTGELHEEVKKRKRRASVCQNFKPGDLVRARILVEWHILEWFECRLIAKNKDGTWSMKVVQHTSHKVKSIVDNIPESHFEKIVRPKDVAKLVEMGFKESVALQTLETSHGNIQLALSLLIEDDKDVDEKYQPGKLLVLPNGDSRESTPEPGEENKKDGERPHVKRKETVSEYRWDDHILEEEENKLTDSKEEKHSSRRSRTRSASREWKTAHQENKPTRETHH